MSPKKANKRASILKKRKSSVESPEPTVTNTRKKGILFSEKKTVKEFFQCDDKATIWGSSYEASIAKSDGSGDGSQTSRKISFDFSSSSIQTSNFFTNSAAETAESEKENFVVPQLEETIEVEGRRTSSLSLSTPNCSSNGSSIENNLTVAYSEEEKKRIKKYGTDNLNISNMQLESSLMVPLDEKRILSPRKTIYFHEKSNFTVSLRDKVLQKPSEVERGSILINTSGDISAMVLDDEAARVEARRKTIANIGDMDLTLQNDLKPRKIDSNPIPVKPSVFKIPKSPAKPKALRNLATEQDMQFNSPPIKHPKLQDPKHTSEDFLDFLVSDTPTKNLCNNMCVTKKHKITPAQSPPPMKCARPTPDPRDLQVMSQLGDADSANNSMDMLKNMGLEFDHPSSQKKKAFDTSLDTSSMQLDSENKKRKSIFSTQDVNETLVAPQTNSRSSIRQTLFENSISFEEPAEIHQIASKESRRTVYDDGMDVSMTTSPARQPQKSFFDLDDGTNVDSKAMTLVNIKNIAQLEQPRQSMALEDGSLRYEDPDTPKGSYSVLMNISNATDISETTTELQAKANRLLQNPMATTASTSNLFTKSFQNDMNVTGVSQKATPSHTSLSGCDRQRKTIYDTNMSLNMSSALEPNHSTVNKSKKSSLVLGSMISMEDVNISGIEPTQEIPVVKPRKTVYEGSMEEESFRTQDVVKKRSSKPRDTILGSNSMETSITEMGPPAPKASSRMTTYKSESIDETMVRETASPIGGQGGITIYEDTSIMEESITDRQSCKVEDMKILAAVKPRVTTFDVSMDEEKKFDPLKNLSPITQFYLKNQDKSPDEFTRERRRMYDAGLRGKSHRQTTYEAAMDEEKPQQKHDPVAQGKRQTTFVQEIFTPPVTRSQKGRHTVFEASMDEERSSAVGSSSQTENRQTLFKQDISLEDQEKPVQKNEKVRQTVYAAEMATNDSHLEKKTQNLKPRVTIYDDAMEESTVSEKEIPEVRDAAINRSMPAIAQPFLEVAKHGDVSRSSTAGNTSEQRSLSPDALFLPPPGFQTPTLTDLRPVSFGAARINHSVSPAEVFKHPSLRRSNRNASTSKSENSSDDNYTFVVKQRDDSRRLMNITDAEFSLLDDESDPCLHEIENSDPQPRRASINLNNSLYHEALQEFVNITLKNTSINLGSKSELPKAQNLDFSVSVDYCQRFEDQINNRKTMPMHQQPKMEIDQFLENLNIRPIQIPRLPQLQHGFLERKLSESSEKHKRKLADQRAKLNAQLPAIPSGAFLMKNYIDSFDDEIKCKKESEMLGITQNFPESRDFQFLLKNKFETDPLLSEFWKLDLRFAHMNQYKLCHKQFDVFKINFSVQNPTGNLNDLSIPVYFENVLLYVSPNSRGHLTLRKNLLMSSFKREICTDNFTSICPSMNELHNFLDMFHARVSKTVPLVDNFFGVVLKHSAIITHRKDRVSVDKRYFNRQTREIVDISISIGENIEDISINDVQVEGLRRFTYRLQQRPAITNMRGLMLIEVILFDIAKFIQENTQRAKACCDME